MLKFNDRPIPKPMKITPFLGEAELAFGRVPVVPAKKGEQHDRALRVVIANATILAIDDGGIVLLDKNPIPLYRALC
jgi:hypothetical protein